jgi:hypothetical protein
MLKKKAITFSNSSEFPVVFEPQPAINALPEWYKRINSYINKEKKPAHNGTTTATVKKCLPVFDAITAGYILFTSVDIFVHQDNGVTNYSWPNKPALSFHNPIQTEGHPRHDSERRTARWDNPWIITTPKGYSTLFVQPMHRESPIQTLEAVVDTDTYYHPVKIPFTLVDPNWEGLIPAGTPIVQVIPFKRDAFKMEITKVDEKKAKEIQYKISYQFFDKYKRGFWNKKEYR